MFDRLIDLFLSLWNDFKPIIFIFAYKKGVMFRGGKFLRSLDPGWYIRIPFIDDYHTEYVMFDTMSIKPITLTTLDGKTICIGGEFDLEVLDIYKASVLTNDWRSNLFDITQGIISDELEGRNWEDIRKKTTKNSIEKEVQKRALEMGISIKNFNFTHKAISRSLTLYNNIPDVKSKET